MSESLGSAVLTLTTDDSGLEEGLRRGEGRAEATAERFKRVGGRMKDVGKDLSMAVTLPIVAFAASSANAASDAAELQSAFDVTFGAMSKDMTEWARTTGDAMGRSTQEIQQAANTFGMFFNQAAPTKKAAAEMSQQFAVLAQDLSSFYNVDPGDAMAKLRSGLSGETEPLRDFGIFMTEATMKAKALEMGLGGVSGELTEQEKIMVRAAIIMDSTKNAQGDVQRTSAGTANQVRAAKAAWDELQVAIGTRLLPVLTPLITKLASALNYVAGLPAPVQTTIMVVAGLAAAVGPLLVGLGMMATGVGTLLPILTGLGTAFTIARTAALATLPALAPFLVPLAAIAAAIGVVWLAWQNWDKIAPVLDGVWAAISGWWTGNVQPLLDLVGGAVRSVVAIWTEQFGGQLRRVVEGVSALLRGDFAGAFRAIVGFVQAPLNLVMGLIERFVPGAVGWFRQLYTGVQEWLETRLGAVFDGVRDRIQAVGDKFKWLWDKVVGHSWIPDLVIGIGYHMAKLDKLMVAPAVDAANKVGAAMAGIKGPSMDLVPDKPVDDLTATTNAPTVANATMPADVQDDWRTRFRDTFRDGVRAAMDGDLGSFVGNFFRQNVGDALETAIDALVKLLDKNSGGGGGGGGQSDADSLVGLAKTFAGFFATGGLIPAGTFGIVGERGPEPVIASPKGALVRPNSTLSTARMQAGSPSVYMPITIDATGADAAAIGRLNGRLDRLRAELPGLTLQTIQDAGERGILATPAWRP